MAVYRRAAAAYMAAAAEAAAAVRYSLENLVVGLDPFDPIKAYAVTEVNTEGGRSLQNLDKVNSSRTVLPPKARTMALVLRFMG